jgi:hypothetical protein
VAKTDAAEAPLLPASRCVGNRWAGAALYPQNISHYAFAQVGPNLYVIAGVSDGAETPTVRRYNATTNVWTQLASFPGAPAESAPRPHITPARFMCWKAIAPYLK